MGAWVETTDTRKIKKAALVMWFRNFSVYVGEREANSSRLAFFVSFLAMKKEKKKRDISTIVSR